MRERAAAAQNAAIDGYLPNLDAVRDRARSGSDAPTTSHEFDVLAYDGTGVYSVTDRTGHVAPVVDVWTFGCSYSYIHKDDGTAPQEPSVKRDVAAEKEDDRSLFDRLRKALPKLSLKRLKK